MTRSHVILLCISLLLTVVGCKKDDLVPNKVPVVNAGPSKTVTLPDSVVLTGSASDSDGHVVAYLWSQISGPDEALIINPGSATTTIKFDTKGSYVFQLMATDEKGATGVDTVSVTVLPNPNNLKTLTQQPSNNNGEYELVYWNGQNQSGTPSNSLDADWWTGQGYPYWFRFMVKFDLSSIPANAIIKSANLYLYSHPNPSTGNFIDANFGTTNALLVQQVSSNWSPSTTTWFNQPAGISSNQVVVPQAPQGQLDINIDVTSQVASMVSTNANYGWLFKLQTEQIYNCRIFVSSFNANYPDKHPKLVITYQ